MSADLRKVEIIFVLGGPCAGKGFLCAKATQEMEDVEHICMGDILRAERDEPNSPWSEQIQHQMRKGGLVSSELSMKLLHSSISIATMAGRRKIILDGFPRNIDQAVLFEKQMGPAKAAISLQCPKEVMKQRLLKRSETSGRIDDNLNTFEKRYRGYLEESVPVIERLRTSKTKLIKISSAENGEEGWIKFRDALVKLAFGIEAEEPIDGEKDVMSG